MAYAIRYEGDNLPLAIVVSDLDEAVRQGAADEARDESRRVKDIVEVGAGDDPLDGEYTKVAGRQEINAAGKRIADDLKRHRDPDDPFSIVTSSDAYLNGGE